ncbi:MAG: MucB/RseB C-terminal domain-containing protein [Alcaligenaceae bacterium]|nr:MucB/RseB C-terminal domain-containing protein [Alcaligenaceae bacterium]
MQSVQAARAAPGRSMAAHLLAGLILVAGLSAVSWVWADEPPGEAAAFLQQVQDAAHKLDYSGVYTYQQGALLQSSRIVHVVDGTGERERLEILDGAPREYLRQDGVVQCLLPKQKIVLIQPHRSDHFPGILLGPAQEVNAHYELLRHPEKDRVAGRECTVTDLRARDGLRYGYRICTDSKTHLILKAQTVGADGKVIDQVAFTNLATGKNTDREELKSPWNTRDWRILKTSVKPVDLAAHGWRIVYPDGFTPLAEISRMMRPGRQADQLVLSDGLAAISIFIETFDQDRDRNVRQGGISHGAMSIYRRRVASYWLTAIGEVPAQTVRGLVDTIEYVPLAAH